MNNENDNTTVYPEQETPPRSTYAATVRGVAIGGWLYYQPTNGNPDNGQITIKITVNGDKVREQAFLFTNGDERKMARFNAKNVWRAVVVAILGKV